MCLHAQSLTLHVCLTLALLPKAPPQTLHPAAHNARFDFHFLNEEFSRARWKGTLHTGICTLALARKVLGGAVGEGGGSYRLGDLVQVNPGQWTWGLVVDLSKLCSSDAHTQRLSLDAKNSHRAGDDAHATALLLRLLLREAEVTFAAVQDTSLRTRGLSVVSYFVQRQSGVRTWGDMREFAPSCVVSRCADEDEVADAAAKDK